MQSRLPNNLAETLRGAFTFLAAGGSDPGSAWRNMALSTVGLDGAPQIRTVVLRAFAAEPPRLEIHTDRRSAKHAELLARPAAALHGWDKQARVQLRVGGTAGLHAGDEVARSAWSRLHEDSRRTYRVGPGPGTAMQLADGQHPVLDEAAAFDMFRVVRIEVRTLDWLHLAQGSHRRARFTWDDGAITATWLAP